jgi:hypothetical protein
LPACFSGADTVLMPVHGSRACVRALVRCIGQRDGERERRADGHSKRDRVGRADLDAVLNRCLVGVWRAFHDTVLVRCLD